MFGGITGARVVQNKPPQLLLAQARIILCVRVCVYVLNVSLGLCILRDEWLFICFIAAVNGWLW